MNDHLGIYVKQPHLLKHLCILLQETSPIQICTQDDGRDRRGLHQAVPRALPVHRGREPGAVAEGKN